MALLHASGYEIQDAQGGSNGLSGEPADGRANSSYASSFVVANRPGSAGTHCKRQGRNGNFLADKIGPTSLAALPAGQTTDWLRFWLRSNGSFPLPPANFFYPFAELPNGWLLLVNSNGGVTLWSTFGGTSQATGVNSQISGGTWSKVDVIILYDSTTAGNCTITVKIDDVQAFAYTNTTGSVFSRSSPWFGASQWNSTGSFFSDSGTFDFDDFTWRDSTGSNCNTAPDDAEQLTVLAPTADSSIGNWTGGAGGATSLFDGVNNQPPVGSATETNANQVKNANKTVPSAYTATCNVDAAVTSGSDVLGITGTAHFGTPQTKTSLTGNLNVNGTAGPNVTPALSAQGTWPFNWIATSYSSTFASSTTVGASYTLAVNKQTSSTSELGCCSLQGYLLTLPPAASVLAAVPVRVVAQAVNRAGTY